MNQKNSGIDRMKACFMIVVMLFSGLLTYAQEDENTVQTIKTVVIDAGHGGKDPGCHGASAHEKHVCLSMALMLGEKIKTAYPEINIVYTRDRDVFVELDERAKIANRNNADLFICIHANSASPSAYGTETYVLGLHRTDAQLQVADRENSIIHLEADGGAKYKDFDVNSDEFIIRQLQLSVYLDQAINFASKLQTEFKSIGRHDRGVRQAGFLVLYKTTMPSVLIETGFLTNPSEEKFLADSTSQNKMASAMFDAFRKYKNELEGIDEATGNVSGSTTVKNDVNQSPKTNPDLKDKIVFRVQVETSSGKLALTDKKFKGNTVFEYQQDGLYKYTIGSFVNDLESANKHKNDLRNQGFENAFVVAFLNGERINLQKAINLAQN